VGENTDKYHFAVPFSDKESEELISTGWECALTTPLEQRSSENRRTGTNCDTQRIREKTTYRDDDS